MLHSERVEVTSLSDGPAGWRISSRASDLSSPEDPRTAFAVPFVDLVMSSRGAVKAVEVSVLLRNVSTGALRLLQVSYPERRPDTRRCGAGDTRLRVGESVALEADWAVGDSRGLHAGRARATVAIVRTATRGYSLTITVP